MGLAKSLEETKDHRRGGLRLRLSEAKTPPVMLGQRIFPVGRGRLIKNKVLPVCT